MHIVYATNGLPHLGNNGVPMLGWGLTKYFLSQGHRVTVVGLCPKGDKFCSKEYQDKVRELGADLKVVPYDLSSERRTGLWSKISDFFLKDTASSFYPMLAVKADVEKVIYDLAPDAVVAVDREALVTLTGLKGIPCLGLMGDPSHFPIFYRFVHHLRLERPLTVLKNAILCVKTIPVVIRAEVQMLACCYRRGAVAAHYAEWFRKKGLKDCRYYRIPIIDEAGPAWRSDRDRLSQGTKFKVILLGALHGTATTLGLKLFADVVYPKMCSLIGADNFEVHIIGSGSWPAEVKDITGQSNVFKRGYVEDLKKEVLSAHVLVVPTPLDLGIRVRILTALSFGQCVVAHRANACGIPELLSGKNCLLGGSGAELAEQVLAVYKDPELRRRLENGARETYERLFEECAASAEVLSTVQEMVSTFGCQK